MQPDVDPFTGPATAGEPPAIIAAMNRAVPSPLPEHPSFNWNWIYAAGTFLLGVMGADPDGQGARGAGSVFGGGVAMLLLGFAVAAALCAWRPSTRRMIPGGAFVVALLAFALPRTAETASRVAFEVQAGRLQGAEVIQHFERLADDEEEAERGPGQRIFEFGRLFGADVEARPDVPPAPGDAGPPRKS